MESDWRFNVSRYVGPGEWSTDPGGPCTWLLCARLLAPNDDIVIVRTEEGLGPDTGRLYALQPDDLPLFLDFFDGPHFPMGLAVDPD